MKQFKVGRTYSCRSLCDSEFVISFTVSSRSRSFITTTDGKRLGFNKKLTVLRGAETVLPHGRHSMCPVISAN